MNTQTISKQVTILRAEEAELTGALKLLEKPIAYTIHYWNNLQDTIFWEWPVNRPGIYQVYLNYSLDKSQTGGILSVLAGDQQIIVPADITGSWQDFKTFDIGTLTIKNPGTIPVILQATQLPKTDNAAMPDVVWISFTLVK